MDKIEISAQLYQLKALVNDALAAADGVVITGAVNWGDLRCVSASYTIDDQGDEGYEVLIEEASPQNEALEKFIKDRLDGTEFSPLEIRFEW